MSSEHPLLVEAIELATVGGEYGPLLGIALHARLAAEEGRYCTCAEPSLTDTDLMCGACLLQNRDQERAAVDRLVGAHDFVPGALEGLMCAVCTMWREAPRHHGISEVGRCSWGEERTPA